MSRRAVFIIAFVLFAGVVIWYGSAFVRVPEMSFRQAEKIDSQQTSDAQKKKVMVHGKVVAEKEIKADGGAVTFTLRDGEGTEMQVLYTGADALTPGGLQNAAKSSSTISVAGHVDPDHFHASSVYLPA